MLTLTTMTPQQQKHISKAVSALIASAREAVHNFLRICLLREYLRFLRRTASRAAPDGCNRIAGDAVPTVILPAKNAGISPPLGGVFPAWRAGCLGFANRTELARCSE